MSRQSFALTVSVVPSEFVECRAQLRVSYLRSVCYIRDAPVLLSMMFMRSKGDTRNDRPTVLQIQECGVSLVM